jgi:hypothetical protein
MRIMTGVGDLVQRIEDGHTGRVLGGRAIERSGDVVCGLHRVCGDEGGDLRGSVVNWLDFNEKIEFCILCGLVYLPLFCEREGYINIEEQYIPILHQGP